MLKEIFELIGLIFRIAFAKASEKFAIAKKFLENAYKRYLRALIVCAILGVIIPITLVILGFALQDSSFFAYAGMFLFLCLTILMWLTKPLLMVIDIIMNLVRHKVLRQTDIDSNLAKRFTTIVETLMLGAMLFCTYMWVLKAQTNVEAFLYFLVATVFLIGLVIAKVDKFSKFIRFLSVCAMVMLFIVSICKFVIPETTNVFFKQFQKFDKSNAKAMFEKPLVPKTPPVQAPFVANQQAANVQPEKKTDNAKPASTPKTNSDSAKQPIPIPVTITRSQSQNVWDAQVEVSAKIPEPIPSGIQIHRGDTLFLEAEGEVAYNIYPANTFGLWKLLGIFGDFRRVSSGPDGMWPEWMTQQTYAAFPENTSGKCWNLLFTIRNEHTFPFIQHAGSSLAWVAEMDGQIWLYVNKPNIDQVFSLDTAPVEKTAKGEFICHLRVGKINEKARRAIHDFVQDSLQRANRIREQEEKNARNREADSLDVLQRPFTILQPYFFMEDPNDTTFTRFNIPLNIAGAFPTGIYIRRGDIISIAVEPYGGRVVICEPVDPCTELFPSPAGIWPSWMTQERYFSCFKETESRKCWNLTLQNGFDEAAKQVHIGEGIVVVARHDGEICLNINKMKLPIGWRGKAEGTYVALVHVKQKAA